MTAALINSNLRMGSLTHCITVGRCKVLMQIQLHYANIGTNTNIQIQSYKYKDCALGSLNTTQCILPSRFFLLLQGIIFDYSLGEAVGDVLQDLLGFDPNFSFFHVTFTNSIHPQNHRQYLNQVGGPDPLSPANLPVANSQSLDLAAAEASDAPVPR